MKKLNRGRIIWKRVCFKTPQRLRPKCDDLQIYGVFTGKYLGQGIKMLRKTAVWSATVTVFWTLQKKARHSQRNLKN